MRPLDGLPISLVDECQLDSAGILSDAAGCGETYGLPLAAIDLFLQVAMAGSGGLARKKIPEEWLADPAAALLPLELKGLVEWGRNALGQPAFLMITWQGADAIEAARPKALRAPAGLSARRRAAVRG